MRAVLLLCLFTLSIALASERLAEFSTSMDFEEFEVVLAHLRVSDKETAEQITAHIQHFRDTAVPGETRQYHLEQSAGYMTLEREDNYAFSIAIFTNVDTKATIESAYQEALIELGI